MLGCWQCAIGLPCFFLVVSPPSGGKQNTLLKPKWYFLPPQVNKGSAKVCMSCKFHHQWWYTADIQVPPLSTTLSGCRYWSTVHLCASSKTVVWTELLCVCGIRLGVCLSFHSFYYHYHMYETLTMLMQNRQFASILLFSHKSALGVLATTHGLTWSA